MNTFKIALGSATLAAIIGLAMTGDASALSKTACRDQWRQMKANGTLNPPNMLQKDYVATCSAGGGAAAPAPAPAQTQAPAPVAPAPQQQAAPAQPAAKPNWWTKQFHNNNNAGAPAPGQPTANAPVRTNAPYVPPAQYGNVVFPRGIDPQFASLSPGKQRFKTCDMQYNANKANGGNGNLKWIEKGGGYWSECNKVLKGQQP